ncbi:uncharacterized protein LOC114293973 [Camellia sinensis]|uniref:uncharacterized protein LOC114293973 n=1 Tax=Camellia sinensis TaxID=4442 RepID=UPI0010358C78|nr:uncharacterized protein LOC114293973 [Camellia sinensis]
MGLPRISLPKKLLEKIRKPWVNALIVRLLGKNIGYKMLCARVKTMWRLQEEFNAIDLGFNYFLFKFFDPFDCETVFTGGPWVIMDHYLTVRRWEPNFKPSKAFETTTAVWVRFPELPIEYYQEKVLFTIAKTIGRPLKIDWTTTMATREKFARVCVEIDLSRPLKPKFLLEGNCYFIEYESLHSFYFLCGRIDHRKETCRFKIHNAPPKGKNPAVIGEEVTINTLSEPNGYLQQELDDAEAFGPWLLVTKRNRRPVHNKRAQDPHDRTHQNKFKSLEEGPDGQATYHRGKKNNPVGHEIAQQEPNLQIGSNQPNEPKGNDKTRALHPHSTDSDNHNPIRRHSSWKLLEEGTSSHHRDPREETQSCDTDMGVSHPNDSLQTAKATELIPTVVHT